MTGSATISPLARKELRALAPVWLASAGTLAAIALTSCQGFQGVRVITNEDGSISYVADIKPTPKAPPVAEVQPEK